MTSLVRKKSTYFLCTVEAENIHCSLLTVTVSIIIKYSSLIKFVLSLSFVLFDKLLSRLVK